MLIHLYFFCPECFLSNWLFFFNLVFIDIVVIIVVSIRCKASMLTVPCVYLADILYVHKREPNGLRPGVLVKLQSLSWIVIIQVTIQPAEFKVVIFLFGCLILIKQLTLEMQRNGDIIIKIPLCSLYNSLFIINFGGKNISEQLVKV